MFGVELLNERERICHVGVKLDRREWSIVISTIATRLSDGLHEKNLMAIFWIEKFGRNIDDKLSFGYGKYSRVE